MVAVSLKKDFFQAEDGIRDRSPSRGLGDVYKRQGLSAYRLIIGSAKEYLNKNGLIALEHGYDQSAAVSDLLDEHGFVDIKVHHDLAGIARAASAKLR